jgi:hypothetical protein
MDPAVRSHTWLASTFTEESNPMDPHACKQRIDEPEGELKEAPEYKGPTLVGAGAMVLAGAAIVGLVMRRLRRP